MLYLNAHYNIINGVSLFQDHEDPLQYYYLPVAPKLTEIPDAATGLPVPQIQVIEYRGAAGNGGFLNFDVNIGVEQNALEDIRQQLKSLEHLHEPPRLVPVPLMDGTVKMMLLDRTSDDPSAASSTPRFVLKMMHNAKPALYGDNQAAFSVELSQEGVVILEKALQGELSPIGIVYSLDFLGLRPAYSVRLQIAWDRVQHDLDEQFGTDSIFFSSDIEKAVDELIDKRFIILDVDTFVPEGEDKDIMSRRDQAVDEVRDMITESFFQPSLVPDKPAADGWDKAEHFAKTVSAIAVTGGWASLGSFTYKKIDYTRIDRKVLNVNINERTTVKRSVYPQGHLSGLFRVLHQPGIDLSRFVMHVDVDDPWFAQRRVNVISRANFEEDSISSLNVLLQYGAQPQNVLLDSSNARGEVHWASIVNGGAMQNDVSASYRVSFKSVNGVERPISLQSDPQMVVVENLEIDPRDLYSVVPVPMVALSFPWDRYPFVEVHAQYADEANAIHMDDTFLLDKDHHDLTWKMFVRDARRTAFQYKVIYRAADHRDVEMPWVQTDEERITIRDPFPQKRALTIVPTFDWTTIKNAFVDVFYEDPANDVSEQQSFSFKEGADGPETFTVNLTDPNRRLVAYEVTIITKTGGLIQIPRSYTLDKRIFVRGDMKGHRIVQVQPEPADWAKKKVKEMVVEVHYEDQAAGISAVDSFSFTSSGNQATFEFDYVDEQKSGYEYRATYQYTNGLSRTGNWQEVREASLVIPVLGA